MKKFCTFAALAMVAIVACNKEIDNNEEKAPGVKPKGEVSIIAQAPAETKTMVDGVDVKWATGDHIGVVDNDGDMHDFTLDSGAGTTIGSFSGSLGGKTAGGYAVYPYTANAAFDGDFTVDYPTTYAYNAVTVPMWGEEGTGDDAGKYSFSHIGGAFKIQYTDVPAGASKFVFTANEDITGTAIYDFSAAVISANEGNEVTVTSVPSNSSLTFLIPVPAGSYSFSVKLLDGSEDVIPGSEKTVSSAKTVTEGHVVPLKAIKVKADRAVTLWSEDFEAYDADNQPSESSASVLWGGNASYTYSGSYCKVYENGTLGSKELLIPKSSREETWVVSNIPTGHWDSMTLTYKSNQNISVTSTDVTVGNASQEGNTYTRTITDAEGLAFFSLTFSMGKDSNARIDDICLITGEPLPGITVTTSAATATSTEAGTTATLNGSITLINSADNANVTEAGFYYKLTSAETYTKVTCAPAPTSTTSFSYELTGLTTDSEYTYYAYAVYDNGSEVTGKATEKTFTPTQSGGGDDPEPVNKSYSFAFATIGSKGWSNSYADHNNVYNDSYVAISIKSASKQTSNVTDYPVTKAGDVIVILKDGTMSAVTFTLTQWTTKEKTVSLQYSTDGGSSYNALDPAVSSNNFTLSSSSLPTGTNAVKMVQGNTSNQVGLTGVSFTYTPSN